MLDRQRRLGNDKQRQGSAEGSVVNLRDSTPPVVLLVDDRRRDLDQAALIAHHLHGHGVECFLEPLEAYRAVLAAYRPGMIVFNHLNGSHLVSWSKRLAEIGVLVAVLPNEGIAHDEEAQRYLAGRYHSDAHVDYFFCWNEAHRRALAEEGFRGRTQIEVTGVPRFDFYFEPWSRTIRRSPGRVSSRPRMLVCTNFGLAELRNTPRDQVDKFFAAWAGRVPLYRDYWTLIESSWNARRRFFDYLDALIAADKFEITLRPHPREDIETYAAWLSACPAERRAHVRMDRDSNISGLILDCDLEVSCESCTTAVESWISGKPTVELVFDRVPALYHEERSRGNVHCDDPAKLPAVVEHELANPVPPELREVRRQYLKKWCSTPDGFACGRIAGIAAAAVKSKQPADWSKLALNDYRRALKLKAFHSFGAAYNLDLLLPIKRALSPGRYAGREMVYEKSIKPRDVAEARRRLSSMLPDSRDDARKLTAAPV
jgi:surface carbohydrate biosynthesis protein